MGDLLRARSEVKQVTPWLIIIILCLVGMMYIVTMPIEFCVEDAAVEMGEAVKDDLIRARHLVTTLLYSILLSINAWFGFFSNIIIFPQLFNIVTGLASAGFLYATQVSMGISVRVASWLTLFYLISNRIWLHSITTVPDIHPQFFLTVSIYFMVKFLVTDKPRLHHAIYSFIGLCIAVLFCLNFVLFIPGFLIAVFIKLLHSDKEKLPIAALSFGMVFLIIIVFPFYIAAVDNGIESFSGFINWIKYHPDAIKLSHLHTFGMEFILRPFSGLMALFVDPGASITILKSRMLGLEISETLYSAIPRLFFSLCLIATAGILVTLGLTKISSRALRIWFIVSCVLFTSFNIWWLGSDPKFWLPLLPLFIILAGVALMSLGKNNTQTRSIQIICLITSLIMIFCNVPKEIPSILFPDGGSEMQMAREFASKIHQQSIIFTPGAGWPDFAEKIDKKSRVINLVYSDKIESGSSYLDSVDKHITAALSKGQLVYFDDLVPPLHARQNGGWLMIKSGRGISREQLLLYLQQKYKLDTGILGLVIISTRARKS